MASSRSTFQHGTAVIVTLVATLLGDTPAEGQSAVYYRIGFHLGPISDPAEEFIVKTSDPSVISVAESELLLPVPFRFRHVNGFLGFGYDTGRYNFDGQVPPNEWFWYFQPDNWTLAEVSIELCDGRPTLWDNGTHFCPWNSFVLSRIVVAADFTSFAASSRGPQILRFDWVTGSEVRSSHFELQATTSPTPDGFVTLATEPATGPTTYVVDVPVPAATTYTFARIVAHDTDGWYVHSDDVVPTSDPTAAPLGHDRPVLALSTPRPNPCTGSTRLTFVVPAGGARCALDLVDAAGRRLVRLVDGFRPAGVHDVIWDGALGSGKNAPPGVYFVRLEADQVVRTTRVVRVP